MAKKQDAFYFDNFITCSDCALRAANILRDTLLNYDPDKLADEINELHKVEHEGDTNKHEMMEVLAKAFITPIEREDIIALSQNIDSVTDTVEDAMMRFYMCNVSELREEALPFAELVIRSCEYLKKMMGEFSEYKKSKQIREYMVEINHLEEEGDKLYFKASRNLSTTCTDPIQLIAWRDIFHYLERCLDAVEHVADTVEMVIMKNS